MKRYSLAVFLPLVLGISLPSTSYADGDLCKGGAGTRSEAVSLPAGTYHMYAKLPMPGQQTSITAYSIAEDTCTLLDTASISGDKWTAVGTVNTSGGQPVTLELNGDLPAASDAAARPQVLLTPTNPPCSLNKRCDTTIDSSAAYLEPAVLTTSSSGLIVQQVFDPAKDTVKEVQYYADGQLMRTTPTLKPFNFSYADYYQQKIARVVVYASKQRAVLESTVPSSYMDNVPSATLRFFVRHSTLLIAVGIGLLFCALIITARKIARHYEDISYYNYAHGLGRRGLTPFEANFKTIVRNPTFRIISTGIVVLVIVTSSIVTANVFAVAPYRVDGVSMFATLQNGQLMMINKLPVSLSRQFKPVRGQVIVFHPNYGNLAYSDLRVDNILVKRIVGLPGERVVSESGKLKVFNAEHPTGYYAEDTEVWGKKVTLQPADEPFDIQLTNDQIFVAGDNRPHSIDSRINGALPLSEVIGVVVGY